ncbi:Rod shape-determining protein RodA [Clostridium sp. N3C]|uniref:rod shape-determining protein RodA n=1 Tax=Clostridium sp. N3C TaxID=1776758 RepID=UPI00092DF776|nr:rod shape-determining protein RodA [Clostridium sp. N3C]SCN21736.1 Rod shape-determining protein RodA [Clostridium sp. N3C]
MLDRFTLNKKLIKHFDFGIVFVAVLIVLFGCINIYNATGGKLGFYYVKLQLLWLLVGLTVMYIVVIIDYTILSNYAPLIYWAGVVLLIYNDLTSKAVNGASSWISIGSRAIQPSEFAKLGMIIMLAKKLEDMEGNINNVRNFFTLTFYALIPIVLIVVQPDMGMTMVCFFIVLGIYFMSGLNVKVIVSGLIGIVILIAGVWNSGLMRAYWKKRLTVFLNPESDELGDGLQLIQSKIGIGSGGITGNGSKIGEKAVTGFVSQFVPESYTDFIFAIVGEKWGLIGGIFLLILYFTLLFKIIKIARRSKDIFGNVICVGIFSSFLFSVIQNIGMTIGILPITGITLPFMSYGGSSLLTNFIALGLVLNIGMRKKKINF